MHDDNVDTENEEGNGILNDDDDAIGAKSRQTLSNTEFKQLIASLNTQQYIPFNIYFKET